MPTIRPFDPERDWEPLVSLVNGFWREGPVSRSELESYDRIRGAPERFLMEDASGRPVAAGSCRKSVMWDVPDAYAVMAFGHSHDETESYREMVGFVERRAVEQGAQLLLTDGRSDSPLWLNTLLSMGYKEDQRNPLVTLDPRSVDPAEHSGAFQRVSEEGIIIEPLETYASRNPETWQHDFWRIWIETFKDVPLPQPIKETPLDEFVREMGFDLYGFRGIFVGHKEDQLLGLTTLRVNLVDPAFAQTWLTGVRREARRKGLATALKVTALKWAADQGVTTIVADNEENNPMRQINLKLGFKGTVEFILLSKEVSTS